MIVFNAPLPCPDPSPRAVRMAIEMREGVAELGVKWRKYGHELGFGVGIAQGYATLGPIGFEGRFDYTAIGTVVNLAARLCGEARSGRSTGTRRPPNGCPAAPARTRPATARSASSIAFSAPGSRASVAVASPGETERAERFQLHPPPQQHQARAAFYEFRMISPCS